MRLFHDPYWKPHLLAAATRQAARDKERGMFAFDKMTIDERAMMHSSGLANLYDALNANASKYHPSLVKAVLMNAIYDYDNRPMLGDDRRRAIIPHLEVTADEPIKLKKWHKLLPEFKRQLDSYGRNYDIKDTEDGQLKVYFEGTKTPLPRKWAWVIADIKHLRKRIAELEAAEDGAERTTRDTATPSQLKYQKKNGDYVRDVINFYRAARGTSYINEAGDLITKQQTVSPVVAAMQADGIFPTDHTTGTTVIPRDIVKKIDPYYKEYNKAFGELVGGPRSPEYTHSPVNGTDSTRRTDKYLSYVLSLRALKNIGKSANKDAAIKEVERYVADRYYGNRLQSRPDIDSMNQLRERAEQEDLEEQQKQLLNAAKELGLQQYRTYRERMKAMLQQAEEDKNAIWLKEMQALPLTEEDQHTLEYGSHLIRDPIFLRDEAKRLQKIDEDNVRQHIARPFDYSKDITGITTNDGWRLIASPDDLLRTGRHLGHCYGRSMFSYYYNQLRDKHTILLNKADVTTELQLNTDSNGIINDIIYVQTKAKNNVDRPTPPEIEQYGKALIGKSINDIEPEETDDYNSETPDEDEPVVSDIFLKHRIAPVKKNANLLSGIVRPWGL